MCSVISNVFNMEETNLQLAQILWDYMKLEDDIDNADVILGLGSTDTRTAQWCAKLYREKKAPLIVFTGARGRMARDVFTKNEADIFAEIAEEEGVPKNAILKESRSVNTGENIQFSYELLKKSNKLPKKLILVTKPYMLRRAYATFKKQWPDKTTQIFCSGIDQSFEEYCKNIDYPFDYVVNVMVGDLQRIIEYPKLDFQIEQEVAGEVLNAYKGLISRGYTKQLLEGS